jgi:integrase
VASLQKVKQHGRDVYRVVFYDKDHNRRYLRLGDMGKKSAESIRSHVEHLADLSAAGLPINAELSAWLNKIGQRLADQLAALGLIAPRESAAIGAFLDAYIEGRTDAKPNTIMNLKQGRDKLLKYFGPDCELRTITASEAHEFRQRLMQEEYAAATVSNSIKKARQFFKVAHCRGLVSLNPFADVQAGGERNDERLRFIDRATIANVLEACPNNYWRLIVSLARFGGLRTPSETLGLKWGDIDWENNRMTVASPKTARQGKPYRIVPLFPELRPFLDQAYDDAPEGAVYVVAHYRDSDQNLRTHFERIIKRAGIVAWPRLFHNLRASRQTELTDQFPAHVVASWLGNTERVAQQHYLQVTDKHFQDAIRGTGTVVAATEPVVTEASVDPTIAQQEPEGGSGGGSGGGSKVDQTVELHTHAPQSNRHAKTAKSSEKMPAAALPCAAVSIGGYARQESNLQPAD